MARRRGEALAQVMLRPQVPMGAFQAIGFVCVLGAVEGLRAAGVDYAAVGWPLDVTDARTHHAIATVRMRAGYDKGMYAECTVAGGEQVDLLRSLDDDALAQALETGIAARVEAWEASLAGGIVAGPLASIMGDYFDALALMGKPVRVVYPNGNLMATGELAGIDVWGRATVRLANGSELEIAPEQATIHMA